VLRPGERFQIAYFLYVAAIAAVASLPGPSILAAAFVAALAAAVYLGLSRLANPPWLVVRDWTALAFTITAYRQMDTFTPARHNHQLESVWIGWDRLLLDTWSLRALLESGGPALPNLLEFCYLIVYAAAPFGLVVLYVCNRPERTWILMLFYTLGAMLSYGCFPYFPSEPPRTVFPDQDLPTVSMLLRRANLGVLGAAGIHSSVFPSAHVSSAFGAAFGMLAALPEKRWIGRAMLLYAALVAVATVYGRYHYAVDALAGLGVGLIAWKIGHLWLRRGYCKPCGST
jgi:membrane-associated phospholipid phosphatase